MTQAYFAYGKGVYMLTNELLRNIEYEVVTGELKVSLESVSHHTNDVGVEDAFLLLNDNANSFNLISNAINNGCRTIIAESYYNIENHSVCLLKVNDIRKTYAQIAKNIFPGVDSLKVVGVVGTNGKSTTSYLIWQTLLKCGIKCGFIGTGKFCVGDKEFANNMTTPDPMDLHRMFSQMYSEGIKIVVMEVSAHAIALKKVYGINYDIAVFTNFSQDHLDYFGELENYKKVKKSFFLGRKIGVSVLNADDKCGAEIAGELALPKVTYGINRKCDIMVKNIIKSNFCTRFVIDMLGKEYEVVTELIGEYNVYNILAAVTAVKLFGVDINKIIDAIADIKAMEGRFNTLSKGAKTVVIDYAHTPDGLCNLLKECKNMTKNELILVFGAGGNRDKSKRAKMGEIAVKYADKIYITSDNPRFESKMKIIFDIYTGISVNNSKVEIVENREDAIYKSLVYAKDDDIVVIAGKGAEKYIEEQGKSIPFNDKETAERMIEKLW